MRADPSLWPDHPPIISQFLFFFCSLKIPPIILSYVTIIPAFFTIAFCCLQFNTDQEPTTCRQTPAVLSQSEPSVNQSTKLLQVCPARSTSCLLDRTQPISVVQQSGQAGCGPSDQLYMNHFCTILMMIFYRTMDVLISLNNGTSFISSAYTITASTCVSPTLSWRQTWNNPFKTTAVLKYQNHRESSIWFILIEKTGKRKSSADQLKIKSSRWASLLIYSRVFFKIKASRFICGSKNSTETQKANLETELEGEENAEFNAILLHENET